VRRLRDDLAVVPSIRMLRSNAVIHWGSRLRLVAVSAARASTRARQTTTRLWRL